MPPLSSLAGLLDLSHTTVSDALRGAGRVDPKTIERVRRVARENGYAHNPLAANLMSQMRRSRGDTFRGLVAVIDSLEPARPTASIRFPSRIASRHQSPVRWNWGSRLSS
jgi:LacI family transcriptional regulator